MFGVLCALALFASAQAYTTIVQKGDVTVPLPQYPNTQFIIPPEQPSAMLTMAELGCPDNNPPRTVQISVTDSGYPEVTIANDLSSARIIRTGPLIYQAVVTVVTECYPYKTNLKVSPKLLKEIKG